MDGYIALIHQEKGSAYGVSFPDVPGCISSGGTFEEAMAQGTEALSAHLAFLAAEGDPIPFPRLFEDMRRDADVREAAAGAIWAMIWPRQVAAPRVRVNIMIDPTVLRAIDAAAEREGVTRSTFIESAAGRAAARADAVRSSRSGKRATRNGAARAKSRRKQSASLGRRGRRR